MNENSAARSVKIGVDERTGWSSERPRREGEVARPVDISTRCRILAPADRIRYSPGSLVVIVGSGTQAPGTFADRVIEERGAVLSLDRVRGLLNGRVGEDELESRSRELLATAAAKRLRDGLSVVVPIEGFDADERERFTRLAHGNKRPRHLVLLDAGRNEISEEQRPALDELRRALDAGEAGLEGFQTALRLGGNARTELKRIVFAPAPRDD